MRKFEFDAPDLEQVATWLSAQPDYAPFTFRHLDTLTLQETYLDTEDWSLFRAGFSLCIQGSPTEGNVKLRRLGSRKNGLREEQEWTQPLPEYSLGVGTDSVAQRAKLITGGAPLQTLFMLETERQSHEVRGAAVTLGTLYLEAVSVIRAGECLRSISRIRVVEAQRDAVRALEPFVDGICEACGLAPVESSLFAVSLEAADLTPEAYFDIGYVGLLPDSRTGEYAYALMRRYFAGILDNEPGTRLGEEEEALHDMRVAIRKSRAAIGIFEDVLSPRFAVLSEELKWLGQALGVVRDLDVQSSWLASEREGAGWEQSVAIGPLIEKLAGDREVARAGLLEVMSSERYSELIASMKKALVESDYATEHSLEPVRRSAARLLRKRFDRFEELASEINAESAPPQYHAVRIRGKRLRYALEAFSPAFEGNERIVRVVDSTKRVQDLLGDFQDCITATARLQEMARSTDLPTATIFLMGQLTERRHARMEEIREAWPSAHESLLRSWTRAQKVLKDQLETSEPPPDGGDGDNGEPPPAVQRPFWLLRRFVGQGRARPDPGSGVADNV